MTPLRVRFGATSTAGLRVEEARTALFAWLLARSSGGTLVLGVEEGGPTGPGGGEGDRLQNDLLWLGIGWDDGFGGEGPTSAPAGGGDRYRDAAEALAADGIAYRCFCPRRPPVGADTARRESGRGAPSRCSCHALARAVSESRRNREPSAVRLDAARAAGGAAAVRVGDAIRGPIEVPLSRVGDFVLLDAQGRPSCDFAAAIDDAAMRITDVVRCEERLPHSARQALLDRASSAARPARFVHLPAVRTPGGARLGGEQSSVSWFREQGYLPEALVNYLALLGWSPPHGQALLSREELVSGFSLERARADAVAFDIAALDSLAARHMSRAPQERMAALGVEQLRRAGLLPDPVPPEAPGWVGRLAMLYSEGLPKMRDLVAEAAGLCDFSPERCLTDPAVRQALRDPAARRVIEALVDSLTSERLTAPALQALTTEVRRRTGAKGRDLYHPLRVALTGRDRGPELMKLLPLIDEGSAIDLPRRIASCAERARALLRAAVPGAPRG